jgi:hypothetical protein
MPVSFTLFGSFTFGLLLVVGIINAIRSAAHKQHQTDL